jgi:hypothetical protein
MRAIHPSLFLVIKRFRDRRNAVQQKYRASESFRLICQNYQKCTEALDHWAKSEHEEAPDRRLEYSVLLKELEEEIIQAL